MSLPPVLQLPAIIMGDRKIESSIQVRVPPEKVFQAITQHAELERWFPTRAETDPRPGGKFVLSFDFADPSHDFIRLGQQARPDNGGVSDLGEKRGHGGSPHAQWMGQWRRVGRSNDKPRAGLDRLPGQPEDGPRGRGGRSPDGHGDENPLRTGGTWSMKDREENLDRIFYALSDKTRRGILRLTARGP